MDKVDRIVITVQFILFIILILIEFDICIHKLEELDKKIDNLNQFKQDSSFIKVNDKLINADNYYQADLNSYTPAKDSVE